MLTFLGHAGFMYETENEILLMDPWMSTTGAFDSSWYQFPSNHLLGDDVRKLIETTDKKVYIYISHEHQDHFDLDFLSKIPKYTKIIIPSYKDKTFRNEIKDLQQFLGTFTDKLKGNAISHARIYVEKDGYLEDIVRMEVQEHTIIGQPGLRLVLKTQKEKTNWNLDHE